MHAKKKRKKEKTNAIAIKNLIKQAIIWTHENEKQWALTSFFFLSNGGCGLEKEEREEEKEKIL